MKLARTLTIIVIIVAGIVASYFFITPESKADDLGISIYIIISNYNFNPDNLTIKAGTTVVWINEDSVPHALKSGKEFQSGNLKNRDMFAHTFYRTGIYEYESTIYANMDGIIIVE